MSQVQNKCWALIAHSAIAGNLSGIMAASSSIVEFIQNGRDDELFIFPVDAPRAGFYIWTGTLDQAIDGDGGEHKYIGALEGHDWIERNGESDE